MKHTQSPGRHQDDAVGLQGERKIEVAMLSRDGTKATTSRLNNGRWRGVHAHPLDYPLDLDDLVPPTGGKMGADRLGITI
ncbi:MAG: hypothetical protein U0271_23485 [Polyangiaceae bacterium]